MYKSRKSGHPHLKPVVGILSGWDFVRWDFVLAPYNMLRYMRPYMHVLTLIVHTMQKNAGRIAKKLRVRTYSHFIQYRPMYSTE